MCIAWLRGTQSVSCLHMQTTNSGSLEVLPHLGGTIVIVGLLVLQHDNVIMQKPARSRGFLSHRKIDGTKMAASSDAASRLGAINRSHSLGGLTRSAR